MVLLHDGFADQRDGIDDGPPPFLDRIALTRAVLDEIAAAGLTGGSLGQALETGERRTAVRGSALGRISTRRRRGSAASVTALDRGLDNVRLDDTGRHQEADHQQREGDEDRHQEDVVDRRLEDPAETCSMSGSDAVRGGC